MSPTVRTAIERALILLDRGEGDRWVAAKLQGVDHPAVRKAVALLRAGERRQATAVLEGASSRMAGPADGRGPAKSEAKPRREEAPEDRVRRLVACSWCITAEQRVMLLGLSDADLMLLHEAAEAGAVPPDLAGEPHVAAFLAHRPAQLARAVAPANPDAATRALGEKLRRRLRRHARRWARPAPALATAA